MPAPAHRTCGLPDPSPSDGVLGPACAAPIESEATTAPFSQGTFGLVAPPARSSRILLIDDSDGCRRLIRHWLRDLPARVSEAVNLPLALRLAESHPPDLILLDTSAPGLPWREALRRLQTVPSTRERPVVLLAKSTEPDRIAQGLDLGAADGLLKPFRRPELQARVRAALRAKHQHDQLLRQASSDALTGLGNRHGLDQGLRDAATLCARANAPMAVWLADLDHFKRINDLHGHRAGDAVLRWAADILRRNVREGDFAGRYGGEEFVVVCPLCDAHSALQMAERFREELKRWPPPGLPHSARLTVSAGVVATTPGRFVDLEEMLHRADACLYAAKDSGRDRSWHWDEAGAAPLPGPLGRREAQ